MFRILTTGVCNWSGDGALEAVAVFMLQNKLLVFPKVVTC